MASEERIVFALPWLVQQVRDRFEAEGVEVSNEFGWRAVARKPEEEETRIVWVPGNDAGGSFGEYEAPQNVGENPRMLAQVAELCTVYIHACDDNDPEDELSQYSAARTLHDVWFRAVFLAASGTFKISQPTWHGKPKERRRGATLRLLLSIQAPIPDEEQALVPVDAKADVTAHALDQSESFTTADPV